MVKYPQIPRDERKNIKLTLKDIKEIRSYYTGRTEDIHFLANKYHVSYSTIRYWVFDNVRLTSNKQSRENKCMKWRFDPEYRRYCIDKINERQKRRVTMDPKYRSWKREHRRKCLADPEYATKMSEYMSNWYMNNRERERKKSKDYYYAHKDQEMRTQYLRKNIYWRMFWWSVDPGPQYVRCVGSIRQ